MEKWNFRDCTIVQLRKVFNLKRLNSNNSLQKWLESEYILSDLNKAMLEFYQSILLDNVDSWNEQELALNFIGPIISMVEFGKEKYFNSFAKRSFSAIIGDIELFGKVDGVIASGKEEPEAPYFCLQEYTSTTLSLSASERETDTDINPAAQALAAMLVAQKMNENGKPVYGAYIRGRNWFFMTLEGNNFSISQQYDACKNEIFDIFRILNGLRIMLEKKFNNQNI
jgi:hypothetical protein